MQPNPLIRRIAPELRINLHIIVPLQAPTRLLESQIQVTRFNVSSLPDPNVQARQNLNANRIYCDNFFRLIYRGEQDNSRKLRYIII